MMKLLAGRPLLFALFIASLTVLAVFKRMGDAVAPEVASDTPQPFTLRSASTDDLDQVSLVSDAIYTLDPVHSYRYPRAKEFWNDYTYYTKLRDLEYLQNVERGAYAGIVAEVPISSEALERRVIAYSFWQLPPSKSRPLPVPPVNHLERRDANFARVEAVRSEIRQARAEWFEPFYGEKQVFLISIAVHPDYQRRGIASAIVRWGLEQAAEEKAAVVLFASPVGALLYSHLGFRDVGRRYAQVEGEAEKYLVRGMVWDEPVSSEEDKRS